MSFFIYVSSIFRISQIYGIFSIYLNIFFLIFLFYDTKKVVNKPIWLMNDTLYLAIGFRPKMAIKLDNIAPSINVVSDLSIFKYDSEKDVYNYGREKRVYFSIND